MKGEFFISDAQTYKWVKGLSSCKVCSSAHSSPFFPSGNAPHKVLCSFRPGSSVCQLSKCRFSTTCAEESQVVGKNPTCPTAEILELKKTKPEREEERGILRKKSGDLIRSCSISPCDWEAFFQRNLELQALAHLLIFQSLSPHHAHEERSQLGVHLLLLAHEQDVTEIRA
jgi:hypothetical protein